MAHVDVDDPDAVAAGRDGTRADRRRSAAGPTAPGTNSAFRGTNCRTRRATSARCRTTWRGVCRRTDGRAVKFYFPDSQDLVSPTYDFLHDEYSPTAVRQRDDRYAHEVLEPRPVPRHPGQQVDRRWLGQGCRQVLDAQRARLYRLGVRRFFRLPEQVETLGDNGAFNYVDEASAAGHRRRDPRLLRGVRLRRRRQRRPHHLRLRPDADSTQTSIPTWAERRLTHSAPRRGVHRACTRSTDAACRTGRRRTRLEPRELRRQRRGNSKTWDIDRIALGGMVPLKTNDILDVPRAPSTTSANPSTELHLLGITRSTRWTTFADLRRDQFRQHVSLPAVVHGRPQELPHARPRVRGDPSPPGRRQPTLKRAILAGRSRRRTPSSRA